MQPTAPECRRLQDAASDYLDGCLPEGARSTFEGHLQACPSCHAFTGELKATVDLLSGLREPAATEWAKAEVLQSFGEYLPEPDLPEDLADWTDVNELWEELAKLPHEQRVMAAMENRKYSDSRICDWLTGRARRVSNIDPEAAVPLAELALAVAKQREADLGDSKRLFLALHALAWCVEKMRDFAAFARLLQELDALLQTADLGSEFDARYLGQKGIYHLHLGEFKEARECLERALELTRRHGSRRDVLCQLVNLTGTVLSAGDVQSALSLGREAERLLDAKEDSPRLQMALYVTLMIALCEGQHFEEARSALEKVREFASRVGGWFSSAYAIWSEGTLLWSEGHCAGAEERFEGVRSEFLERGLAYWYVEASLDLARVYVQQGRWAELSALASELLVRTKEMDSDQKVQAAVESFAHVVQQRSVSDRAIGSIAVALGSARLSRRL